MSHFTPICNQEDKCSLIDADDYKIIRKLFDDYLQMYATRDDRLTMHFSENFSGFTGGGDFLVKDRAEWVTITRQDFAQVKEPLRIELKDLAIQSLSETVAVTTGFFSIHLPIKDHILSQETARLVLIFRNETSGWKISHSSISIPYHLVREGEIYPMQELVDRNQFLETQVIERTIQLSEANNNLHQTNTKLECEIAKHKQTEQVLLESEEIYRSILNYSPDDITIADLEGRILMCSPAASTMFGFNGPEEGIGLSVMDFIIPEDRDRARSNMLRMYQGGCSGPNEYRGVRKDRTIFNIEVNSGLIRGVNGQPTKMVIIVRDITERKNSEQRIQHLIQQLEIEKNAAQLNAITDSLTGLANRRHFDETIRTEYYRMKRSEAPLSLLLLDIDHFKKFNDYYGHLAGDKCLQQVGAVLKTAVGRAPDVVARYGGEEFIIVLPETEKNGAIALAERIRQTIEDLAIPHAEAEVADHLTVSIGVVTVSSASEVDAPEQIVAMADTALYSAKRAGRNRYCCR